MVRPVGGSAGRSSCRQDSVPLDRCPGCQAAAAPTAEWCTLCFAALRPTAEPVTSDGADDATVASPGQGALPPAPRAAAPPSGLQPDSVGTAVTAVADRAPTDPEAVTPPAAPAWPCPACGVRVPLDRDNCPECGSAFLAAVDAAAPLRLPLVGDVTHASKSARLMIGLGAGAVFAVILLALLWVVGSLL